jgi:hypothetical protein
MAALGQYRMPVLRGHNVSFGSEADVDGFNAEAGTGKGPTDLEAVLRRLVEIEVQTPRAEVAWGYGVSERLDLHPTN